MPVAVLLLVSPEETNLVPVVAVDQLEDRARSNGPVVRADGRIADADRAGPVQAFLEELGNGGLGLEVEATAAFVAADFPGQVSAHGKLAGLDPRYDRDPLVPRTQLVGRLHGPDLPHTL